MNDVQAYIARCEPEIQVRLNQIRDLFFEQHPDITETISYQIPAYRLGKQTLYFAAFASHIGFYPVYGLPELEERMSPYRAKKAKHSLHFKHSQPLPLDLIRDIIRLKSD